jgi:hypothetical protein
MVAVGAGYKVDVSSLEQTVTKLRAVAAELGNTQSTALYNTTIGVGVLGANFQGATGLLGTHDAMQTWIAEMIGQIQSFIDEYSGQTKQVVTNYSLQEDQTKQDLYSNG